jgi:hypothetical protein
MTADVLALLADLFWGARCVNSARRVLFSMWRRLTAATLRGVESAGRAEGAGAGADRPPVWDL